MKAWRMRGLPLRSHKGCCVAPLEVVVEGPVTSPLARAGRAEVFNTFDLDGEGTIVFEDCSGACCGLRPALSDGTGAVAMGARGVQRRMGEQDSGDPEGSAEPSRKGHVRACACPC